MNIPILLVAGPAGSGKDTVVEICRAILPGPVVALGQADPMKRYLGRLFSEIPQENLWGSSEQRELPVSGRAQTFADTRSLTEDIVEEIGLEPGEKRTALMLLWSKWLTDCNRRMATGTFTCRHALQQLGTEVVRAVDPDAWIDHALYAASCCLEGSSKYCRTTDGLIRMTVRPAHLVVIPDGRFANEVLGTRAVGGLAIRLTGRRSGVVGNAAHVSETRLDDVPDHFYTHIVDNSGSLEDLHAQLAQVLSGLQAEETMSPARLARRGGL